MATLTYTTTTNEDNIIAWELARRAKISETPPKDGQELLTIEFGHILRQWWADRKSLTVAKLQNDPSSITSDDKDILGIK